VIGRRVCLYARRTVEQVADGFEGQWPREIGAVVGLAVKWMLELI